MIRAAGETTYSDEILTSDCDKIDTVVLSAYLTPIADSLSLEGKESFVSEADARRPRRWSPVRSTDEGVWKASAAGSG
jgi:hypothetical protein